jgi:hypothetical protein
VSTRHDRFILDSLFALQHAVGQMAGVSIKDLASEAKVAQEELGWSAAWGMSGLHSQRDVIR